MLYEPHDSYSTRPGMSWKVKDMTVYIFDHDVLVMKIFLGEAIESTEQRLVEEHIKACKRDLPERWK